MSNDKQQADVLSAPVDTSPQSAEDWNPLTGPVNNKNYSQPNVQIDPNTVNIPIPEPDFRPPPMSGKKFEDPLEDMMRESQNKQASQKAKEQAPAPPPPLNPGMKGLSGDEMQEGAEHMAEAAMAGYELVNHHANGLLTISERRVLKMVKKGELDPNASVPYDIDKTMRVSEFIRTYNDQTKGTFYVSQDFRDKVMPLLIRVLKKRGAGLTDEQLLMIYFGKDIWIKAQMGWQMRSTLNQILSFAKAASTASTQPSAPAPPPPPVTPPPPPVYDATAQAASIIPSAMQATPGSPLDSQMKYLDTTMPTPVVETPPLPPHPANEWKDVQQEVKEDKKPDVKKDMVEFIEPEVKLENALQKANEAKSGNRGGTRKRYNTRKRRNNTSNES